MNMFRALRADEIDCRIAQVKDDGLSLLLYKDARCDQNILDETVGPKNWQKKYTRDNRNCIVSIWDEDKKQWIEKEDTGTESNTEKEKGLASDSFKRACFCWGIGRELYTSPFIWIAKKDCNIGVHEKTKKPVCYDRFTVEGLGTKDGVIVGLKIKNQKTKKIVFNWGDCNQVAPDKPQQPDDEPESEVQQEPEAEPKPLATIRKTVPPVEPVSPVKKFIINELNFMGQMFGINDKTEMFNKFAQMRKTLVDGGVIEDVDSEHQTLEQAQAMIDAIYANFKPNGEFSPNGERAS